MTTLRKSINAEYQDLFFALFRDQVLVKILLRDIRGHFVLVMKVETPYRPFIPALLKVLRDRGYTAFFDKDTKNLMVQWNTSVQ